MGKGMGKVGVRGGWVPACAGMTDPGRGDAAEGERRGRSGRGAIGGGSGRSTPHLTSPLEGGRDELGGPALRGGKDGLGKRWSLRQVEHGEGGVVVVVVEGCAVLAGYL